MTTLVEYRELADDDLHETRATTNEDGSKWIEGYAIRYGVWSQDLGGFRERLNGGSAEKSLQSRNDVKALVNHESRLVIGSTRAKTLTLDSGVQGVRDLIALPDTTYANDLHTVVGRKDVRGQSFGFSVPKGGDEWNDDFSERVVNEFRLHEVSVVTFPAYTQTSVSARSLAMFEARSGRDGDDLAAAIEALRTGAEMTDEHADILTEAVLRSRGTNDDEAAEIAAAVTDLRNVDDEDVADELFLRRARLRLRERTLQAL